MICAASEEPTRIYNGSPCRHCGSCSRYTSTNNCIKCQIAASMRRKDEIEQARYERLDDFEKKMKDVWYA